MKSKIEKITGLPKFVLNIILVILFLLSIVVWGKYADEKAENRFQICSKYTIANITDVSEGTFKNTNLVYAFHYKNERVEYTGRPNPKDIQDWLSRDDKYWQNNWKGRRIWIQFYCSEPKIHRVIWNKEVPDSIINIPEIGWQKIP